MSLKDTRSASRHMRRLTLFAVGIAGAALLAPSSGASWAAAAVKPTFVYVGSYKYNTKNEVEGSTDSIGLSVFKFDSETGALTPIQQVHSAYPSWIALHPSKQFLYACYALSGQDTKIYGSVEAYAIDPDTGTLTLLNRVTAGIGACAQHAVDPTGRYVVVANYLYGDFAVLPIEKDGRLGPVSGSVKDEGKGPGQRQDAPHPHAVAFTPNGRFVVVADLGNDKVQTLQLVGGALKRISEASVTPGMGPRHVAFSHDGKTLYVIGEIDGTITAFAYDPVSGKIGQILQSVSTEPPGYSGNHAAAEIDVHPSGKFLYGSNRGSQTIVGYRIDPATEKLSVVGFASQGVQIPNNFVFDPTGKWMYVVNLMGNNIEQFNIDPETGTLSPSGQTTSLVSPTMMVFRTPR